MSQINIKSAKCINALPAKVHNLQVWLTISEVFIEMYGCWRETLSFGWFRQLNNCQIIRLGTLSYHICCDFFTLTGFWSFRWLTKFVVSLYQLNGELSALPRPCRTRWDKFSQHYKNQVNPQNWCILKIQILLSLSFSLKIYLRIWLLSYNHTFAINADE